MNTTRSSIQTGVHNRKTTRTRVGKTIVPRPTLDLNFITQGLYVGPAGTKPIQKPFSEIIEFSRDTPASLFNEQGIFVNVPAHVPRFDHDPYLKTPLGLLIEETRTNYLRNSNVIGLNGWTTGSSSEISRNVILSPDGLMNGARISHSAGNGAYVYQSATVPSSATVTLSVYAIATKPGDVLRLRLLELGGATPTGTQLSPVFTLTDKWQRYTFTATVQQSDRTSVQFVLSTNPQTEAYVWGGQLEVGGFATSLIVTTDSTAFRRSDIARMLAMSPWFNPTEGTLYTEVGFEERPFNTWFTALSDGTLRNIIDIGTVLSSNINRGRSRVLVDGVTAATANSTLPLGVYPKLAVAYGKGQMITSTNGALIARTLPAVPVVTQLGIGNISGFQYSPGYLRSIRYYPRFLSNPELQTLTQQ